MKAKILNLLLLLSALMGYLAWGGNNQVFLFQVEAEVLSKLFVNPMSVLHPLVILPMFGQALLLISLFQKMPNKWLTYIAIACIGILLGLMFVIGLISMNYKMLLFSAPFLILSVFTIRSNLKK